MIRPEAAHRRSQGELKRYLAEAGELGAKDVPVRELAARLLARAFRFIFRHSGPPFIASLLALRKIRELAGPEGREDVACITRALPHNVTTEMGLALYQVARVAGLRPARTEGILPSAVSSPSSSSSVASAAAVSVQLLGNRRQKKKHEGETPATRAGETPATRADKMSATRADKMSATHADKMSATHMGKMPSPRQMPSPRRSSAPRGRSSSASTATAGRWRSTWPLRGIAKTRACCSR